MDEAKIATGRVRTVKEFAESDWVREWNAVRTVSDRAGGEIKIPGRPWHFGGEVIEADMQIAAYQGEHNTAVLAAFGYSQEEIAELMASGALVEPRRQHRLAKIDDGNG
jgi:crotonobetainyl-CoA:carnitine CoA-transferase CaiB-like acyl-CoA transferase